MKKSLLFLAALAVSSALCAQENQNLGREDVLSAFKQYNPAAFEKASANADYNNLLNKLASAYSAPRTEANQTELIALVKNFDNSISLEVIRQQYVSARTLQAVSGTELQSLDRQAVATLLPVVENIFENTLEVRKIQIQALKKQIKAAKKDKTLSKEQRKGQVAALKAKIKALKAEIKGLKSNSKQKIQDAADTYFADIRSNYEAQKQALLSSAQKQDLQASQTDTHSVKANHKKPVAK